MLESTVYFLLPKKSDKSSFAVGVKTRGSTESKKFLFYMAPPCSVVEVYRPTSTTAFRQGRKHGAETGVPGGELQGFSLTSLVKGEFSFGCQCVLSWCKASHGANLLIFEVLSEKCHNSAVAAGIGYLSGVSGLAGSPLGPLAVRGFSSRYGGDSLGYDATSTKTTYRGNAGCRTAGSETSGSSTAGYPSSSPVLSSVRQPQQQVPPPPVINLQQQF
ncbi:hypothetical protein Bbelb_082830 [Branchiostoma belcheri]|nr:hypothetical protein Bbelb_082830 [Branchiostoma belcheri]